MKHQVSIKNDDQDIFMPMPVERWLVCAPHDHLYQRQAAAELRTAHDDPGLVPGQSIVRLARGEWVDDRAFMVFRIRS